MMTNAIVDPVEDYAVMSLQQWRRDGRTDLEILAIVSRPHPADAAWEAAQRRRCPVHVYCSPADVKAHIRRLLVPVA